MARSWRSFFRRNTDEEQVNGPAVASEPEQSTQDVEEDNGHLAADLESFVEVPSAEEVQAERKEPVPEDVWEVEETEPGDAQESLPEPDAVEEAPETIAERQESGGWFGKLRQGLSRSRASFVGQLNAAVAEFRDVEDEEFWERVEEILISSDVGVPTTAKLVAELEQEALERNITSGAELRELMIEHAESPRIPTRPAQEHAEQERQREQGPFAAGQYAQGPPALPPQSQPYLHPVLR